MSLPLLSSTEIVAIVTPKGLPLSAVTKSSLPSPLKSAAATPLGPKFVPNTTAAFSVPEPVPGKIETMS
jgi:hypothetical protein